MTDASMKPRFYNIGPAEYSNQDCPKVDGLVRKLGSVRPLLGIFSNFSPYRDIRINDCICFSLFSYSLLFHFLFFLFQFCRCPATWNDCCLRGQACSFLLSNPEQLDYDKFYTAAVTMLAVGSKLDNTGDNLSLLVW